MQNLRVLSSLDEGDDRFDVREAGSMEALAAAEDRHFWHASRNRFIAERLRGLGVTPGARVLELGCGGGCVAAHLSSLGYDVVGVEGHASLARRAAARASRARFLVADLAKGIDVIGESGFDVACLFDVLEHLDAPAHALADALRVVRPGGLVVGTVPALRSLWSVVDENAGHRLRYERDELLALVDGVAGAGTRQVVPFNRTLVPLMWLQRRRLDRASARSGAGADHASAALSASNLAVPPAPLNRGLYWLTRAEHRASRWLDRTPLAGASLWFAIEKV